MSDIIRMAREAGFHRPVPADGYMGLAYDRREGRETGGSLERFAALVTAAEREACAKLADELTQYGNLSLSPSEQEEKPNDL